MLQKSIVVMALAITLISSSCGREPNPSSDVSRALTDANIQNVTVDWDKGAHIAHLRGAVDRATDRQRAEEVAAGAVGTKGRVLNELTIRGMNDKIADDLDGRIKSVLKQMVHDDPVLRDRDIEFEITNGVVTVKGEVGSAAEKQRVTDLVKAAPGVKDMANAVEIKPTQ